LVLIRSDHVGFGYGDARNSRERELRVRVPVGAAEDHAKESRVIALDPPAYRVMQLGHAHERPDERVDLPADEAVEEAHGPRALASVFVQEMLDGGGGEELRRPGRAASIPWSTTPVTDVPGKPRPSRPRRSPRFDGQTPARRAYRLKPAGNQTERRHLIAGMPTPRWATEKVKGAGRAGRSLTKPTLTTHDPTQRRTAPAGLDEEQRCNADSVNRAPVAGAP
jgi:hypothetical protein